MEWLKKSTFVFGLSVLVFFQGLALWSIWQMQREIETERTTAFIHNKADEIVDGLQAVVSNKRAFLLTRNEVFLMEYRKHLALVREKVEEISNLLEKDQLVLVLEASYLVGEYQRQFELLAQKVNLQQPGRLSQALIQENVNAGQVMVEAIQQKFLTVKDSMNKRDQVQRAFIVDRSNIVIAAIAGGSVLTLLLFTLYSYGMRLEVLRKEREKAELDDARLGAQEASRLKSKFLATVSHEVRTPLNGIIGMSQVLANSNLPAEHRPMVEAIGRSGDSLLKIINDILDYSKIEAKAVELNPHRFQLEDLMSQLGLIIAPLAVNKGLVFQTELDPGLPREVVGDSERLLQVLTNLAGNAVKFTARGSVTISVRRKHFDSRAQEVILEFSVEDTGPGISEEQQEKLFTPFFQGQTVGTSGEPGTGLGLAISKSIVDSMQGTLGFESTPGSGTVFRVELPFKSPSNATLGTKVERPVQRSEEPQQRPGLQLPLRTPLRVLLVEDNFTNQMVARLLLLKLGAEVSTANDGEEGLSALEHGKFDLVLMDCQMPVLDGLEATRRLREQGHRIPVIAVTANASTTDEENCRASGMDGYLSKPYTLEGLHAELLRHIPVELLTPYDPDVLQDLAVKLSPQAAREVWLSYLSTLTALAPVAPSAEELTVLQRLGHKFKSSSRTVGAFKLAVICERLEEASSLTEARKWFSALGDAREELLNLDINIFTGAPHEHDGKESSYS